MTLQQDYVNRQVMIQLPTGQEIVGEVSKITDYTLLLENPFMISLNTQNQNVLMMPFTLSMIKGNIVEINLMSIFSIAELSDANSQAYKDHVRSTVGSENEELVEEPDKEDAMQDEEATPFMSGDD